MSTKIRTLLIIVALAASLTAVGLAAFLPVGSNPTPVRQSGHVSEHSVTSGTGVIQMAPATTTTTTIPVAAPKPAVAAMAQPVKTQAPTTTVPPVRTTEQTTIPVVTITTTTTPPTTPASVSVQASTVGDMTAPDGTACAAGPDLECVLLTANGVGVPPEKGLTFVISDAANNADGQFTTESDRQTYCLIHWWAKGNATIASSPDCLGGPLTSTQTTIDFSYTLAIN